MERSQTKDVVFFNALENPSNLTVIMRALKCYTSVTFGVIRLWSENPVVVRVQRHFFQVLCFEKK